MTEVGYRRGATAEKGAGASGGGSSEEVVVVVGLFGTMEPLDLG